MINDLQQSEAGKIVMLQRFAADLCADLDVNACMCEINHAQG